MALRWLALSLVTSLAACSSGTPTAPPEVSTEKDREEPIAPEREAEGATLDGAGLHVRLFFFDGSKPKTRGRRYLIAKLTRDAKTFDAFCTLYGEVEESRENLRVACGVETKDDTLWFSFVLRREENREVLTLERIDRPRLDGPLSAENAILGGSGDGPFPLEMREAQSVETNPWMLGRRVLEAVRPLLAPRDGWPPIASTTFSVTNDMRVVPFIHPSDDFLTPTSLLQVEGDLAYGIAATSTLTMRVREAKPM
jgi:hypothetical protein